MMLGLKYHRMFIANASLSGVLVSAESRFEETVANQGIRKTIVADLGPLDNPNRMLNMPARNCRVTFSRIGKFFTREKSH